MKTFMARIEERYVWDCPYCGKPCCEEFDDPEDTKIVTCPYCNKKARCEYTDRG